ncbi:MAG: arginine deiminase family protein [Nocardioides sp.]|uniref:dimethylarginine dimethylaminohydrolase family protein n=1 Tax=Nocardioides sp. TaxID=35761 RepID=UPI0039E63A25
MSSYGVRSMTAPLRRAALRVPATTGDFASAGWPEDPDPGLLLAEHAAYTELLRGLGVEVELLEAMPTAVDATFAYDPVFVTGRGVIVLDQIKPVRTCEPPVLARELEALGLPIIGALSGGAHADGGDLMWLDEDTLALGRGYRTNTEAHRQLTEIMAAEGVHTVSFDLPHAGGRDEVLHLMSVVSLVNEHLAVVYEPLTPVPLMEALEERGIDRVPVSAEEYDLLGSNVLAVSPDHAVIFAGAPAVVAGLEEAGVEVTVVSADQIALGTGGPTCLTRPLHRD